MENYVTYESQFLTEMLGKGIPPERGRTKNGTESFQVYLWNKFIHRILPYLLTFSKSASHIIWASTRENLSFVFANNKGADQLAHLRSLISTFVIHLLESIIYELA